jgi:hypothetical protein
MQRKRNIAVIVRSGAKIRFLGDDTVLANSDFVHAIKRYVVANPRMITNYHLPRVGYSNSRPNQNIVTYFGAEKPQSEPPPRVKQLGCRPHKKGVKKPPKLNEPSGPPARRLRQSKLGQILEFLLQC